MKEFIKKHQKKITVIGIIIMIISLSAGFLYYEYDSISLMIKQMTKKEIITLIICIPGSIILLYLIFTDKIKLLSVDEEVNDYYQVAKTAILSSLKYSIINKDDKVEQDEKIDNNTTDIMELMLLNMKEIKEYYVLSKTMAKRSFILSVIMCVFGFIIISASIIAIFMIDISFIQLIIPVIGGTVVEIIAGTSLVVYKKSLEQLNQYYESLHSNERFLSLVNLVDKLSDDKKDETYINIINNQLEVLKNTQ